MKNQSLRLLTIAGTVVLAAAVPARARSAGLVTGLGGSLNIHQGIPCGHVDRTTAVTSGQILISPAEGIDVPGGKSFAMTRANISFAPFTASGSCYGFGGSRHYEAIGVQVVKVVIFTAVTAGPGVYGITIPKEHFLIYEAATVDGEPETAYKEPSEDVTGTIDLVNRTLQIHVVLATRIHFKEGCIPGLGCTINETDDGTLTADISGVITLPDVDGDGVADGADNCRFTANPDQSTVPNPVVTAPPNVTLASCLDRHIGSATGRDVCDRSGVSLTNNAPATFAPGNNTVTWTGTDGKSRSASATQAVNVVDQTKPTFTFVPLDITLNTCGPASPVGPTATDDCAGAPVITSNAPASFQIGTTPVAWTATDVSGNAATATQSVTVVDTTPPVVTCTPAAPPGNSFIASAHDACDTPTIRLGSYALAQGEQIKIEETGQPGVRLIDLVGPNRIRHFHVGKGQGVITATDASGNRAIAVCR